MKLKLAAVALALTSAINIKGDDLDINEIELYADVVAKGEETQVKKESKIEEKKIKKK